MSLRRTLLLLASACVLQGAEVPPEKARASFTTERAVVTGIVEGVTEFLPVSSTGHLIVSDRILGVPADPDVTVAGVADRKGRPVDLKRVADDYVVIVQFGAILAVLLAYRRRVSSLLRGLLRRDPGSVRLAAALLIAFAPAAALGLAAKDFITAHLFTVPVVAGALFLGGILTLMLDRRLPEPAASDHELSAMGWKQAALVGVWQCAAFVPGTSRSLATILGARHAGLSRLAATEFSFLLGLVTLTAASAYKAWSLGPALAAVYPADNALLGLAVAALSAFLAVSWMVGYVSRNGLSPFGWYRIAAGVALLAWHLARAP
ncbi:MAG: undecaprenyl-diphosphate phosphatase [Opitutia bacterium]